MIPLHPSKPLRAEASRRRSISLFLVTGFLFCIAGAKTEPQESLDPTSSAADVPIEIEGKTGKDAATAEEGAAPLSESERPAAPDPVEFFRKHFFPFEPFYFIAGTETPNAKFQISLKYQLFTDDVWLATQWSGATNLFVAYTQTSLWDWNEPSAPFYDTSYKPELNYTWLHVDGGHWGDWIRLDLQGGLQHESNGKDEADSRSLNIAYLRTTVTFGRIGSFQVRVSPKVFVYLGDLGDNPDIADYRGYVELRTILGWSDNVQLSATTRVGNDFDRASLQLDLTYPMWKLPLLRSSLFLQAQYFTGYGESLLRYDGRSDSFRAGFALFR
jgi:outer membrane phospholipase A